MSEVNQAFLRAYLKNRALQPQPTPSTPSVAVTGAQPNSNAVKSVSAIPHRPSGPPEAPTQTLPSGVNLRFDRSHTEQNYVVPPQPATPLSTQSKTARVSPRPGVWSPLGVERGMKALEATSLPAVVRNGVTPVTSEATQFRRPLTTNARPQSHADLPEANTTNGPNTYVDGLAGHPLQKRQTGSAPRDKTPAEFTESVAHDTGGPSTAHLDTRLRQSQKANSSLPTASRSNSPPVTRTVASPPTTPVGARPVPAAPSSRQAESSTVDDSQATRRFDSPQSEVADEITAPIVAPLKSKTSAGLNTALPLPVAFNPSWEVDQFFWPEVVKQIESSHSEAFRQIGKHLSLANRDGLKVMAITSGERGVGRSTVAMHMARCAASSGLRVALIDGDTSCPSLIDQLRLDMQQGWQDCLFENVPLHEIAVHSIADGITFFPLTSVISQQQMHVNLNRMAKLIRRISNAFDMVFIDANRLNLEQRDMVGVSQETVVDAAIVVVDTELSIKEKVDSAVSILQWMGISSIGLVENFQS